MGRLESTEASGVPFCYPEPMRPEQDRLLAWRNRPRLDPKRAEKLLSGIEEAEKFFMGESRVQRALNKVVQLLEDDEIPYALIGAMALNEHGYHRVTVDVDLLMTREGLEEFKAKHLGLGYVQKFPGSKGLKDTQNGVSIDVVLTGEYPGDGQPKPVAFPDPAFAAERNGQVAVLPLPRLIELKIASGMTAPHRLKDLADVLETIRVLKLPAGLAEELNPYVQAKYLELWQAAQAEERE